MFISLVKCRPVAQKLLLFAGLVTLSISSYAGSYRVAYDASACRTIVVGPSGEQWYASYWEQDGSVRGGESSRDPDGPGPLPNTNLGPGSVSASGTIKVTFTWVPSYAGDTPPKTAIVEEYGYASWIGTSGNCSDGAGGTPTNSIYQGSSSNTRYWIKKDPGESFTFNVNPSASANRTPGYVEGVDMQASASITYRSAAAPLRLWLIGTARSNGSDYAEIGQKIGAEPTVEDRTFAPSFDFRNQMTWHNPHWTIEGDIFKRFAVYDNTNIGYRVDHVAADFDDPGMRWCWIDGDIDGIDNNVICWTDIYVFGNSLGRVSLAATGKSVVPNVSSMDMFMGETVFTGNVASTILNTNNEGVVGCDVRAKVTTHADVARAHGNGKWMFVQLCRLDRQAFYPNFTRLYVQTGQKVLDGTWGYDPLEEDAWIADGAQWEANDSPTWPITGAIGFKIDDVYDMYVMYCPPGGEWIPLQMMSWQWKAFGDRMNQFDSWPEPINASLASGNLQIFPDHPSWSSRFQSPGIPSAGVWP